MNVAAEARRVGTLSAVAVLKRKLSKLGIYDERLKYLGKDYEALRAEFGQKLVDRSYQGGGKVTGVYSLSPSSGTNVTFATRAGDPLISSIDVSWTVGP